MADEGLHVLLVVGSDDAASFAARALMHPAIEIVAAREETLVGLLGSTPFNLAVVGGTVGTRGPLNLCEAVRMSQNVPVLILVGPETSEMAIGHHKKRGLQNVHYLDITALQQPEGSLVDLGKQLRGEALHLLSLAEENATGAAYLTGLEEAQAARDAAAAPPPEEPTAAQPGPATPANLTLLETELGTEVGSDAPPFRAQLTDEDLEFAARMIDKTKSIDFRAARPRSGPPVDATEAKTRQLRDRIRKLEKQQARLAFVYRSRKKQMDSAGETIAALEKSRSELEGALQVQQQQLQQSEQQHTTARAQQEQQFSGMLSQAQQAFEELREQSGRAIEQGRTDLATKQGEVDQLGAHMAQMQAQLETALAAQSQLQEQMQTERQQLLSSQAQSERSAAETATATAQQLQQEHEVWAAERGNLFGQIEALTSENQTLRQELDRSRDETAALVSQLGELRMHTEQREATYAEDVGKVQEMLSRTEAAWLDKHNKLKESATTFRDAYQEHEAKIREQQATIDDLNSQVQDRSRAVESLERDVALDKRLGAIESAHKGASKDLEKALDKVRSQLAAQESLLEIMATVREPIPRGAAGTGPMWIAAKPVRLAGAAGVLVLLTALLVFAIMPGVPVTAESPKERPPTTAPAREPPAVGDGGAAGAEDTAAKPEPGAAKPEPGAAKPEPGAAKPEPGAAKPEPGAANDAVNAETDHQEGTDPEDAADAEDDASGAAPGTGAAPGGDEARKELRKQMLKAHAKRRWAESVQLGQQLRRDYHLDWETEFKLGEAHQRAGEFDAAVACYDSFATTYPENAFADDALFRAGSIRLAQKKMAEARERLAKVAALAGSPLASKARSLLEKIK